MKNGYLIVFVVLCTGILSLYTACTQSSSTSTTPGGLFPTTLQFKQPAGVK